MMCEKKIKFFLLPKLNTNLQPFVIAPAASAKRTVGLKFTSTKNINGLEAFQEAFAVVVGFTTIFGLSIVPEFVVRQRI